MDNILDLKESRDLLKDNVWRSKAAMLLLLLTIIFGFVRIFVYYLQYDLLESTGGSITHEQYKINSLRIQIASLIASPLAIVNLVFLIMWFRRAYANLQRIGVPHLESPDSLAAWCWFIPIFNLFKPFAIMKEICDNTTYYVEKANPEFQFPGPGPVIGWWWAIHVLSALTVMFRFLFMRQSLRLSNQIQSTWGYIFSILFEVTAAALLLIVIRRLLPFEMEMQEKQEEIHAGFDVHRNEEIGITQNPSPETADLK